VAITAVIVAEGRDSASFLVHRPSEAGSVADEIRPEFATPSAP
jgi:hypothetical protein